MFKFLKKLSMYIFAMMIVFFIGFIVIIPFAVKNFIEDVNIMNNSLKTTTYNIDEDITKLVIRSIEPPMFNIRYRQSDNGKCYIENYKIDNDFSSTGTYKINFSSDEGIAYLDVFNEYKYNNINIESIKRQIFSDNFIIHPDIIIYIPDNIEIEFTDNYRMKYFVEASSSINFVNKDALIAEKNRIDEENYQRKLSNIEMRLQEDLNMQMDSVRNEIYDLRNNINSVRDEIYDLRNNIDSVRNEIYDNFDNLYRKFENTVVPNYENTVVPN